MISNIPFFHSLHPCVFSFSSAHCFFSVLLHFPFSSGLHISSFVCISCTIKSPVLCGLWRIAYRSSVRFLLGSWRLRVCQKSEVETCPNTVSCFRMHFLHSGPDFDGDTQHCVYSPSCVLTGKTMQLALSDGYVS